MAALIEARNSWQVRLLGSSIVDDLSSWITNDSTVLIDGTNSMGIVCACAIQGNSGDIAVRGVGSNVAVITTAFHGYTNAISNASSIGNVISPYPLFVNGFTSDLSIANFSLATNSAFDIAIITDLGTFDINIPADIEYDYISHLRSTLRYDGRDYTDAGAIEYNYLSSFLTYKDPCDAPLFIFTEHGRNTIIRSMMGEVCCKIVGYAFGRGGYNLINPVKITPIDLQARYAVDTIEILDVSFDPGDIVYINTIPFEVGVDWFASSDIAGSVVNLAAAINLSTADGIYHKVLARADNAAVQLSAVPIGSIGNTFTLTVDDQIPGGTTNFSVGSTNFSGGSNEVGLIDQIWPTNSYLGFTSVELPNPTALSFVSRLGQAEGNYGLGEIGIFAEITDSQLPVEIGTTFLMLLGHFPIQGKNSSEIMITRSIAQL